MGPEDNIQWHRDAAAEAVRVVVDALRARGGLLVVAANALERNADEATVVAYRALEAAWVAQRRAGGVK
jgi:hypothetical protein